jgi:hypothetical protein
MPELGRLRNLAFTGLMVSVALYFAVHLVKDVLPELITTGVITGVMYVLIIAVRHRKSRW